MEKQEILNDELVENEVQQPKSHKKIKIAIAIAASLAIIATTTLLVGYFKFDWFKSEIYNVDAKISRNVYQTNYFTETKTIKTKTGFTSGVTEEKDHIIYTNFMVMQTDRKELENNDYLNTATLVILDAKLHVDNKQTELTSFNIFEQSKIDEFKANPNGSKYPMAIFSFYENGTVADIQLPNNMDSYYAQNIIEMIDNVIPKLTRNRTEDISNGLNIETKKDKKKRTLVETQAPKEITNFQGSRFVKSIKREIDDGRLTKVQTDSSLSLESKLEEDELDFGLKDFYFNQKSEIISTGIIDDKKNAELLQGLTEYYTFIKSKDLLDSLAEKNKDKEYVIDEWEEDLNNENSELRKLGFNFNAVKTWDIKSFKVLGVQFSFKFKAGVQSGKALCQLIIQTNLGSMSFGNTGVTAEFSKTFSTGDITIFKFVFPPFPAISLALKAGGSLSFYVKFDSNAKTKLNIRLSGSLYAKCEIKAGWDAFASVSAGAKGTILTSNINVLVGPGNTLSKTASFTAGTVQVYVKAKALMFTLWTKSWTVFKGWTINL